MLAAEAPVAFFIRQVGGPILVTLVSIGVVAAIFNA